MTSTVVLKCNLCYGRGNCLPNYCSPMYKLADSICMQNVIKSESGVVCSIVISGSAKSIDFHKRCSLVMFEKLI